MKPLIIIELNEFNVELLRLATVNDSLPNIKKILCLQSAQLQMSETKEHQGLDPWVQWVSIHTGKTLSEHQIMHLGQIPDLGFEQLWETLSKKNISTGVWGAMNASRRTASNCKFFMPDPWTYSEPGYPKEINDMLQLPRYYSKHYLRLSLVRMIKEALFLLPHVVFSSLLFKMLKFVPVIMGLFFRFGIKNFVLFLIYDIFSTIQFVTLVKKHHTKCSILFLNSLAHLQHHHWQHETVIDAPIRVGLKVIDQLFGYLWNSFSCDHTFIFLNGLSQVNVYEDDVWVYRHKDPENFLRDVGIVFKNVEQCMTHDGFVFFEKIVDRDKTFQILNEAHINGERIFYVEKVPHDDLKLFYRIKIERCIEKKELIDIHGKKMAFYQQFQVLAKRTGGHVPQGTCFFDAISLPQNLFNHELKTHIVNYFK